MRIGIICQYFPPEVAPIGVMLSELAQDLSLSGHDVTIFTGFPNHPGGKIFVGYERRIAGTVELTPEGVVVLRNWIYVSTSKSFLPRVLNYLSFAFSTLVSAISHRQDVYLIISPPLSNIFIGLLLRLAGRRYMLNVQDIYPDAAVAAGLLRNRLLIQVLARCERLGYFFADTVTVISEGFRRNLLGKGVPPDKLEVISNWIDLDEIHPLPKSNWFSQRQGVDKRFTLLYSGTVGVVSGAEIISDVAYLLKDDRDILLMVVGEGVVKAHIKAAAVARGLDNMLFLPFQPRQALSELLSSASVGLVTLKRGHGGNSVPSKILGYLAVARPVIASVDPSSDTWEFIEAAQCGICVRPGDAVALAEAVLRLRSDPKLCDRLGQNGRKYLEKHFGRSNITAKYEEALCPR